LVAGAFVHFNIMALVLKRGQHLLRLSSAIMTSIALLLVQLDLSI